MERVVVKIGGSVLFSENSLSEQVAALMRGLDDAQVFVIVGGGEIVEAMRILHRFRPSMDLRWIHWECVRLLDSTFAISQQLMAGWKSVSSRVELDAVWEGGKAGVYLVRVGAFYDPASVQAVPLEMRPEESWETTTDALAWYLGWRVAAKEVWLLKSCDWAEGNSLGTEQLKRLAREGIIDRELPRLAALIPRMRIRICGLSSLP